MKKLDRQRKVTLAVLSMALVVAVYLNWQYSRTGADVHIMTDEAASVLDEELAGIIEQQTINPDGDLLAAEAENAEETAKNYGDAQLVATTAKSAQKYFEETRLTRQKSRDEALDVLQKTLKNAKIPESEKTQATEKLAVIVKDITTETDVENLVKAKGFSDCVAFISDGKITVAVQTKSGELTKQNVAQIRDIVLSKTAIDSQNIVVIEVK
ncbi:MAG: SpoIIIAH-like family protein [Oscillospiraceae bacterium]|nr:SpoIIIAH-like family protein [Oscillospiraceae bacterium]